MAVGRGALMSAKMIMPDSPIRAAAAATVSTVTTAIFAKALAIGPPHSEIIDSANYILVVA